MNGFCESSKNSIVALHCMLNIYVTGPAKIGHVGHMIFAYFFKLSSFIMFCTIMLWQCNFHLIVIISI